MQWAFNLLQPALELGINLIILAIGYGMLRAKVESNDEAIERIEESLDHAVQTYVNYKHFESVIGRVHSTQDEMQRDIKQILGYVSKK